MSSWLRVPAVVSMVAVAMTLGVAPAAPKEFTASEKANERLAKKLAIPVYFAVPSSARLPLSGNIDTTDVLVDFKHPDAIGNSANLGLRLIVTPRSGMARRLAKSGLVQTGDLLLTFRPEWGGSGAYPNIQMGISHTGVAYVKDGEVHNIDNPMNEEYLGSKMRADLTSEHYRTLSYIHIIRPRGLSDTERKNIVGWATRLHNSATRVYQTQISFNDDYNAPKFKPGQPSTFVKTFGQVALGQNPPGNLNLFCSEFAWSLLSLRNCDPATTGDLFKAGGIPACIREPMKPMAASGDYVFRQDLSSYSGLADGPLMVINALNLPSAKREALLDEVFVENPANVAKLSPGHKAVAQEMQPKFERLRSYYLATGGGMLRTLKARLIRKAFSSAIPENYSPTSYLINTLLPPSSIYRTMDYVATVVIE